MGLSPRRAHPSPSSCARAIDSNAIQIGRSGVAVGDEPPEDGQSGRGDRRLQENRRSLPAGALPGRNARYRRRLHIGDQVRGEKHPQNTCGEPAVVLRPATRSFSGVSRLRDKPPISSCRVAAEAQLAGARRVSFGHLLLDSSDASNVGSVFCVLPAGLIEGNA